ncbi:Gfo/Idh/MocA family protein [Fodinibius salsisoli]|uniref:Gfo/Idh/MocA family oxidoreductase n=1 Tax=Fodinibius salsisoli TaxID=2820877 RepID=A0ABT3PQ72_9BACT|nr:Gfo/Idh/MocA family oxidoreductase [Fodinibius salsisoli]MCW9707985.1 Gfo/Idh/MocA family oxidoreductase [Fodinibius salsisoli]
MSKGIDRKDFLKTSALTGLGLSMAPFSIAEGKDDRTVSLGFLGVGSRGTSHLNGMLNRDDVEIKAILDPNPDNLNRALDLVEEAGQERPEGYSKEEEYIDLCERDDLDGVIIASPWRFHAQQAVAAMENGKYAGVEVPAGLTIEECWQLVRTSERTGMPCMMLENVCYRRDVLAVLNMVREGLFGEMIHARCGYQHDLTPFIFNKDLEFGPGTGSVSSWRTEHYTKRNGDHYPTHGIGPVAHWLDINRGNRFVKLTSNATKARGLESHIEYYGGEDHPNEDVDWQTGDVITTTITTANGETIIVTLDTTLPRPYSLGFRAQGTNGLWELERDAVHIRGRSEQHQWEEFGKYQDEFDSILWKKMEKQAEGSGHGGMDFFVRNAFVESIKRGVNTPMDAYDAASWSVIFPLSENSIAKGGAPVEFPDFTGGQWLRNEPIFHTNGEY